MSTTELEPALTEAEKTRFTADRLDMSFGELSNMYELQVS